MTLNEAKKVAELWKEIGHGESCGDCCSDFADACQRNFPEFSWSFVNDPDGDFTIEVTSNEDRS